MNIKTMLVAFRGLLLTGAVVLLWSCSEDDDIQVPLELSFQLEISDIKHDGALCKVSLMSNWEELPEKGIVFGTSSNPVVGSQRIENEIDSLSFQNYLRDLISDRTYYVRAYAKDLDDSVYYSAEQSFTTLTKEEADPFAISETVHEYSGYELVWSDEFDIDGPPSSADWNYEMGYVRNNEDQYYSNSEENCIIRDGSLVITARKDHDGYPYTSSSINTWGTHYFMYGRFEIRAKIPTSSGCWPAIWTTGSKYDWPIGGEIDIMEFYDQSILANAAWSANQAWTGVWDSQKIPITRWTNVDGEWVDKYHIWRMDWDSEFIKIYMDGELLNTIDLSQTFNEGWQGNRMNPFRYQGSDFGQSFILNLALGGNNGGVIDDSAFPIEYKVDYIRAYQFID